MPKTFAVVTLAVVALLLTGCGGSSSGGGSQIAAVQGGYFGSSSLGYEFITIVLPNGKIYAVYGTGTSDYITTVYGLLAGTVSATGSTFTASATDFYYGTGSTLTTYAASISGSYVSGSSISGNLTESSSNTSETFTGAVSSTFNFNTPAQLSQVTGIYTVPIVGGGTRTITINSNGSITGSNSTGCTFTGSYTPDPSYNFFTYQKTYNAGCTAAGQTYTGVAVDYLESDGVTHRIWEVAFNSSNTDVSWDELHK